MTNSSPSSTLSRMIQWLVVGFLAIVALKVALFFIGFAIQASIKLLFMLGPLMLIGWLSLKALRYFTREQPSTI